jgi:hypothetical protein
MDYPDISPEKKRPAQALQPGRVVTKFYTDHEVESPGVNPVDIAALLVETT